MNIIDAWKELKKGNNVEVNSIPYAGEYWGRRGLAEFVGYVGEINALSNNWEVERKPLVWEGEVSWQSQYMGYSTSCYPPPEFVYPVINSDKLSGFVGKRTRIRIEEII